VSLNDLGLVYHEAGLHAAAEEALGRALTVWEAVEGPDHPGVATTLNNLGEVYRHRGKLDEAEYVLTRALEIRETRLEPGHVETAGPDR
jgi:tetratricopeptide (TPR) repeat protein